MRFVLLLFALAALAMAGITGRSRRPSSVFAIRSTSA